MGAEEAQHQALRPVQAPPLSQASPPSFPSKIGDPENSDEHGDEENDGIDPPSKRRKVAKIQRKIREKCLQLSSLQSKIANDNDALEKVNREQNSEENLWIWGRCKAGMLHQTRMFELHKQELETAKQEFTLTRSHFEFAKKNMKKMKREQRKFQDRIMAITVSCTASKEAVDRLTDENANLKRELRSLQAVEDGFETVAQP